MNKQRGDHPVSDQIFLRDHIVDFEIGAFTEERDQRQRLAFTVVVDVPGGGDVADDVDKILSYDVILGAIEGEIAAARVDLLETLAEGIAARILAEPLARRVRVCIEKLDRVSGRLGIEIIRTAAQTQSENSTENRPMVHCIGPDQPVPDLDGGAHVLLIAGKPGKLIGDETVARRLSLLACEVAGWERAATLDGVHVVATRTELEHAIKEQRMVIWAPSKMVFDAGGGVASVPTDIAELAIWFATKIAAKGVQFWGVEIPDGAEFDGDLLRGNDA